MKLGLIALFCVVILQSCTVPPTVEEAPKVTVSVATTYGSEPFALLTQYDYNAAQKLKFNQMQFLISNLELLDGSKSAKIADYALVDIDGNAVNMGAKATVTPGNYTRIRFGVGVDAAANAKQPSNFASSSPLSSSSWYWDTWNSFTFLKTAGFIDGIPTGFSYHTGRDTMYRVVELPINYTAKINESTTLTLKLDLKKLFINGVDTFNINQIPQTQAQPNLPGHVAASIKIADNFKGAWSQ